MSHEPELADEFDDDAYFAGLAAGTAAPASALTDADEPAGTAGRAAAQPASPAAASPQPPRAKLRRRRGRPAAGPNRRSGAAEKARARPVRQKPPSADIAPQERAEGAGDDSGRPVDVSVATALASGQARRWRPRRAHVVCAVALVVVLIAAVSAGSERPVADPAKAGGAANGTPAVRGSADLRLAWRAPSDARPRELTLGGRLTTGPRATPVAGARLHVLAGDQAGTARQLARVRTDRAGRFRLALSIAGRPPGLLTVSFLARRGDRAPAALDSARLRVRSAAPPSPRRRRSRPAERRGKSTHEKEKKR